MKVINFGSLNLDYVYQVPHIVQPGETISSNGMAIHPGGKGANQAVALARAGATVWQAGQVGTDGKWLREMLAQDGVDVRHILVSETCRTGHAIIQVDSQANNSIVVYGGANQQIPTRLVEEVLAEANPGDWLVLQNEINLTASLLAAGSAAGMKICFNPAPFTADILDWPLHLVDVLIVNEIEALQLSRLPSGTSINDIVRALPTAFPRSVICVTLGAEGALCLAPGCQPVRQQAYRVPPVDTTAAGDTFTGYFLAEYSQNDNLAAALKFACRAAAVTVSRPGAIPAIPTRQEVLDFHFCAS